MSIPNDIFHSKYYRNIDYAGYFEMPVLKGTNLVPDDVIEFTKARNGKTDRLNAWVVPYQNDKEINPMWTEASRYLQRLLQHPGIISWDFSMYRNMPFSTILWNCFRGRLIGALYEREGGICIPNIRPCDERSIQYIFDGLPTESTISMGTHGAIRHESDRIAFAQCVDETVRRLRPNTIVVYGKAPYDIFHSAYDADIRILPFPSAIELAHSKDKVA